MQSIRQHRRWQVLQLVAGLLAVLALPVGAEPLDDRRGMAPTATQRVDLVQASRIARMELGGEIIKAELTRYRGTEVYMVRLLDQGRVREALIDAATGAMLSPGQSEEAE